MRNLKRITGILVLSVFVAACGGTTNTAPAFTTITKATLTPNDAVPPPTGPVVLTLTGKIGATNGPARLDFDLETLERLGVIEFAVDDPFLKRRVTYQGVLLQQVLDAAHVPQDATILHALALNDYATDVQIQPLRQWPVMVATKRDGQRMPVADKGPLEIVFPYNSYQIDPAIYDTMWVWQLRSFEVK